MIVSDGNILIGKCTYDEGGSDTCDDDNFLSYSWTANLDWLGAVGFGSNPDELDYALFDSAIDPDWDNRWHYDPLNTKTNKRVMYDGCRSGSK